MSKGKILFFNYKYLKRLFKISNYLCIKNKKENLDFVKKKLTLIIFKLKTTKKTYYH